MRIAVGVCVLLVSPVACAPRAQPAQPNFAAPSTGDDAALAAVRSIHGGAGPWAVAGYRMGRYALARLGLARGSTAIEVTHFSPPQVQYACIADGAAAATGASLGKLNLARMDAPDTELRTVYRNRNTGEVLTLRLTSGFVARFLDVPRERLAGAGREVLHLSDEEIFEIVAP